MIDSSAMSNRPKLIRSAEILIGAYKLAGIELQPFVKKYIDKGNERVSYLETEEEFNERQRIQNLLLSINSIQSKETELLIKEVSKINNYANSGTYDKYNLSHAQVDYLKRICAYLDDLNILDIDIEQFYSSPQAIGIFKNNELNIINQKTLYLRLFMLSRSEELKIKKPETTAYNIRIQKILLNGNNYNTVFNGATFNIINKNILPFINSGDPSIIIKVLLLLNSLIKYYKVIEDRIKIFRSVISNSFNNIPGFVLQMFSQTGIFTRYIRYIQKQILYIKNSMIRYSYYLQSFTYDILLNPTPEIQRKRLTPITDETEITGQNINKYMAEIENIYNKSYDLMGDVEDVNDKLDQLSRELFGEQPQEELFNYDEHYIEQQQINKKREIEEKIRLQDEKIEELRRYKNRKKELVKILLEKEEERQHNEPPLTRTEYKQMVEDAEQKAAAIIEEQNKRQAELEQQQQEAYRMQQEQQKLLSEQQEQLVQQTQYIISKQSEEGQKLEQAIQQLQQEQIKQQDTFAKQTQKVLRELQQQGPPQASQLTLNELLEQQTAIREAIEQARAEEEAAAEVERAKKEREKKQSPVPAAAPQPKAKRGKK